MLNDIKLFHSTKSILWKTWEIQNLLFPHNKNYKKKRWCRGNLLIKKILKEHKQKKSQYTDCTCDPNKLKKITV